MKTGNKTYLGDGCYADYDGFHIVLTTENGISAQNTIYLDDQVRTALFLYYKKILRAEAEAFEQALAENDTAETEDSQVEVSSTGEREKPTRRRPVINRKWTRTGLVTPALKELYTRHLRASRWQHARSLQELRKLRTTEQKFAPLLYLLDPNPHVERAPTLESAWLSGSDLLYVRTSARDKAGFSAFVRVLAEKLDTPPSISVKPGEYMADFDRGDGYRVHVFSDQVMDCKLIDVEEVVRRKAPHPECLAALQELEQL